MIGAGASPTKIYEAVAALSRSIAGRSDLESPISGAGESLRRVGDFDYVGMTLHDPKRNRMQGRFLEWDETPAVDLSLPLDPDPAGWVWLNQQPLVIRCLDDERAHSRRGFGA